MTAARELFVERGYADTSIADIASAAEVSPQTVYAVFGGKAGVLARVVDVLAGGDEQEVLLRDRPESVAALGLADGAQRLRALARLGAEINQRVGPVLRVVETASGADDGVRQLHERLTAQMHEDNLLVAGLSRALLRPDLTVEEVADVIRAIAGARTWYSLVVEGGWSHERYAAWLEDALVRLLLPAPPDPVGAPAGAGGGGTDAGGRAGGGGGSPR